MPKGSIRDNVKAVLEQYDKDQDKEKAVNRLIYLFKLYGTRLLGNL